MQTVEAQKWNRDLGFIESVDRKIGEELEKEPRPNFKSQLEQLLLEVESELNQRNVQLKKRDEELIKNIDIITILYSSNRYRLGNFVIKPIEKIALKLGLVKGLKTVPENLLTQDKRL